MNTEACEMCGDAPPRVCGPCLDELVRRRCEAEREQGETAAAARIIVETGAGYSSGESFRVSYIHPTYAERIEAETVARIVEWIGETVEAMKRNGHEGRRSRGIAVCHRARRVEAVSDPGTRIRRLELLTAMGDVQSEKLLSARSIAKGCWMETAVHELWRQWKSEVAEFDEAFARAVNAPTPENLYDLEREAADASNSAAILVQRVGGFRA